MHSWENDTAFVGEPLNHIHEDTKSARLIAVCSFRSIEIEQSQKRSECERSNGNTFSK